MYKMGCWEIGDSRGRSETGFRGEATGDKSLDRELRETGVRTGASSTGRTRHERPGHLTLSRQNIFFPDVVQKYTLSTVAQTAPLACFRTLDSGFTQVACPYLDPAGFTPFSCTRPLEDSCIRKS